MKEFNGLASFASFAAGLTVTINDGEHDLLDHAGKTIKEEAKSVIGTYSYGWPPLAESTLKNKAADTPLLETGKMRDSIEHTVIMSEKTVCIGSNEDTAVWQELGTSRIPPRSFLVGAATHKADEVVKAIGTKVHKLLIGAK